MCAVGKRVPVSAVRRVLNVCPALGACCDIGENESGSSSGLVALDDGERFVTGSIEIGIFQTLDKGERRFVCVQTKEECVKNFFRSLGVDENTLRGVLHAALESQPGSKAIHKRPEPDALHGPPNNNMNAVGCQRMPM